MADLGQAFSRIVPHYDFHPNQAILIVEDLDHSLGRHQPYYPCQPQNRLCSQMSTCQTCSRRRPYQ